MLLKSLYDYAERECLLDDLPFQERPLHYLLPVSNDGKLIGQGAIPLFSNNTRGKVVPGEPKSMPRFPGENNGGKAYHLAESWPVVLGVSAENLERFTEPFEGEKPSNAVKSHRHYWERVEQAYDRTKHPGLKALLDFRQGYLATQQSLPFLQIQTVPPKGRKKHPEDVPAIRTEAGSWVLLKPKETLSFQIEDTPIFEIDEVRQDWRTQYHREASSADTDTKSLCLVSGQRGEPVARSHKPTILGVPGLAAGGYLVSFAKEAPAFSSFGFEMGQNAPVSERAASSYALALNALLGSQANRCSVGETVFCFWTEKLQLDDFFSEMFAQANPDSIKALFDSPFLGSAREILERDKPQFHSVALSANAARVVVRHWIRQPLERAILHLRQWFEDLQIVSLQGSTERTDNEKSGPLSLFRLSAALVRQAKDLKAKNEAITALYRCALDGTTLPLMLLVPILQQFRSALTSDGFPYNQSRFALIKLILCGRHREGGTFMPEPTLADTPDVSYNLGRLLTVLDSLQDAAHQFELKGAGVIERYYGAASATPATVFPLLFRLHNHHLRKLEQLGNQPAATAIRNRIAEILAKIPPSADGTPSFPSHLSLEEQGRFALGFYQQKAFDNEERRKRKTEKQNTTQSENG